MIPFTVNQLFKATIQKFIIFHTVVSLHRTQDSSGSIGHSRRRRRNTGSHRNYLEEDSLDRRHQLLQQQQMLAANRYPEAGVPVHTPEFVTLGQKYSVAIGSTIVLPCKINESGESFGEFVRGGFCCVHPPGQAMDFTLHKH